MTQANVFLQSYIDKFNKKFGDQVNNTKSAFEEQPEYEKINRILDAQDSQIH